MTTNTSSANIGSTIYRSFDELPLLLRVEEIMPILSVGRNTAYELLRCGAIRSIRVGKQLRIPKQALIEYISPMEPMAMT